MGFAINQVPELKLTMFTSAARLAGRLSELPRDYATTTTVGNAQHATEGVRQR